MPVLDAQSIADVALAAGFPKDEKKLQTAVAVALAESGGNTQAVSPTSDYGLWQINLNAHRQYNQQQMFDPAQNARAMIAISGNGTNWKPWVVYNTGRHLIKWGEAGIGVRRSIAVGQYMRPKFSTDIPGVSNPLAGVVNAVASPLDSLNELAELLGSSAFWRRAVGVGGGVTLVVTGLVLLNRDLVAQVAQVVPVGRVVGAAGKVASGTAKAAKAAGATKAAAGAAKVATAAKAAT